MTQNSTPQAIDINDQRLSITWADGHKSEYPAGYVRAACQCAACVSEITGERTLDRNSIPENIHFLTAEPTGHYAITAKFSDHHDTGIFTFEFLRQICPCPVCQKR